MFCVIGEGAVVFDNLASKDQSGSPVSRATFGPYSTFTTYYDTTVGQGFRTGSSAPAYNLSSVTIALDRPIGAPYDLQLAVHASEGGLPGDRLFVLSGPTMPTAAGNYTYSAPAGSSLAPDASYFIVAGAKGDTSGNNEFLWYRSTSSEYASPSGWSIDPQIWGGLTQNGKTQWLPYLNAVALRIDAVAVPEPRGIIAVALGTLLVFSPSSAARRS
jgi:hypothetical protein